MIIARSPLRISLGGGGTDLPSYYRRYGGFLISGAIDKYVYISIHRSFHPGLLLRYSKIERCNKVEDIKHPIFREALKLVDVDPNHLEITSFADLPAGTGMGSSGSFGTALLRALYMYKRSTVSQQKLAELASHIEIDLLEEPVGKQDQYAAAFGGVNCYEFKEDGEVFIKPLDIPKQSLKSFNDHVMLFSTGLSRSASQILKEQDDKTKAADKEMIENLHYVKEIGYKSKALLESGDLEGFGHLLHEHWQYKRKRSALVSTPEIDRWYSIARNNSALGGKLIGAGGGGFIMFCAEDRVRLRRALIDEGLEEWRFSFVYEGTKILDGVPVQ